MEGKSSFVILIAIVAFLSLTLALLAGYVFFGGGNIITNDPNPKLTASLPKDEELIKLKLYEEKKVFNLKGEDNGKMTMLQISAELVYFKEIAGIKNPSLKIGTYKSELAELVSTYFQGVTSSEVKTPEGREKIKVELIKRLNAKLKENEKSKNDLIYNIILEDWLVYQ